MALLRLLNEMDEDILITSETWQQGDSPALLLLEEDIRTSLETG